MLEAGRRQGYIYRVLDAAAAVGSIKMCDGTGNQVIGSSHPIYENELMKAFITGGTGFIGSHLADELVRQQGVDVACLVRSDPKWLTERPVKIVKGDLNDLKALREGMQDAQVVYHCAGVVKAPTEAAFVRANVDATENLIRMAQKMGVPKIVVLSSLAAAGPSLGKPLDEAEPMRPVSMYGRSKKAMEEMIALLNDPQCGTSITVIRPPAVYGPREQDILTIFKMAARGWCPIVGDGKSTRLSMVHVRDLVEGMQMASRQHEPELRTFYISGEPPVTWDEFRVAASRALGRKVHALRVSPSVVQRVAAVVEKGSSFFGSYPVLNREKAREMVLEWTCSTARAREELGFRPKVSLDAGVFETVQWYKAHHWI